MSVDTRLTEALTVLGAKRCPNCGRTIDRGHVVWNSYYTDSGTAIALRRIPRNDVSNVRNDEGSIDKPKRLTLRTRMMSDSNVSSESNVRSNVNENSAYLSDSDITDNTDIRNGEFSGSGEWWPREEGRSLA